MIHHPLLAWEKLEKILYPLCRVTNGVSVSGGHCSSAYTINLIQTKLTRVARVRAQKWVLELPFLAEFEVAGGGGHILDLSYLPQSRKEWCETLCLALKEQWVPGASLVAQWWRICLPMQETWVWSLVWKYFTCHGTTKPVCPNCWAYELEPWNHNYWARVPQLLKSMHPRARALQQEKPLQRGALTL